MNEPTARQVEIIRATIALIAEEGVHNFSIRKLAKRVGVTEPAVYRHFGSKDDLMINLATYIVRNWHQLLGELVVRKLPVIDQTRLIFGEVMDYFDQNRAFTKTLLSTDLFANDSGMTAILLQLKRDGVLRFTELILEGQSTGEVRTDIDVVGVTHVFFGSVWWVVTDWIENGFADVLSEKWERMWQSLVLLLAP